MVVYTPFILFYGQDANGDCYVNLLSSPDKKQNGTISGLSCYNRSPSGDYRHPLVVEENLGGLKASSHPHPVYKAKPPTPCWSIIKMQRVFWPLTVEACGGEEPCQVGNFFFFKGGGRIQAFRFLPCTIVCCTLVLGHAESTTILFSSVVESPPKPCYQKMAGNPQAAMMSIKPTASQVITLIAGQDGRQDRLAETNRRRGLVYLGR